MNHLPHSLNMCEKKTKREKEDQTASCKPVISDGNEVFKLVLSALRNLSLSGGGTTAQIYRHILNNRSVNMSYEDLNSAVKLALHKAAVLGFLQRRRTDCKYYIAAVANNRYKRKYLKYREHKPPTYISASYGWGTSLVKKGKDGMTPSLVVAVKSCKGRIVPQKAKTAQRWIILPLGTKNIKPPPPPPPPTPSTPSSRCFSASSLASRPYSCCRMQSRSSLGSSLSSMSINVGDCCRLSAADKKCVDVGKCNGRLSEVVTESDGVDTGEDETSEDESQFCESHVNLKAVSPGGVYDYRRCKHTVRNGKGGGQKLQGNKKKTKQKTSNHE